MTSKQHLLGHAPIPKLIKQFAIPAIIANVVNTLYNIVDQIFIGQGVGYLGNAATNIAFPITTITMAISLLIGVGAASKFNLEMGRGNKTQAKRIVGNAFASFIIAGLALIIIIRLFLEPLMIAFGATDTLLEYAMTYTSITSLGIPFLIIASGGNALIRADGSAKYSMNAILIGAILNTILDPIFIFGCHWGIAGAAWATVISQMVSGCFVLYYLKHFKQVTLQLSDFKPSYHTLLGIAALGLTPMLNQLAVTAVQVITNNLMKTYGELSIYGGDIPIAVSGIVQKLNFVYSSVIIGLTQGAQPILGFNFGAKQITRVKETYFFVIKVATAISIVAWLIFQIFTTPIISLFGSESQLYMTYAQKYMHIYLAMVFINGSQIISTTFFASIGKAKNGALLTLCKQLFFVVPLLFIFTGISGVDNIMFATPLADLLAWLITMYIVWRSFKTLDHGETLSH